MKKTAQMQKLLAQNKAPEVVAQFATEDISKWPFWKRGDGYFTRGRAFAITGNATEAERDLTKALEWTSDKRVRESVTQALARLRSAE